MILSIDLIALFNDSFDYDRGSLMFNLLIMVGQRRTLKVEELHC